MRKTVLLAGAAAVLGAGAAMAQSESDPAFEAEILRALGEPLVDGLGEEADALDDPAAEEAQPPETSRLPAAKPPEIAAADASLPGDVTIVTDGRWIYTEGIARAVRREYLTFQAGGRVAYVDPPLREGVVVQQGQTIAYQEQSQSAAEVAGASAQVVDAQSSLTVAQASKLEADANLAFAQRTFDRFAVLLQQNSASRQEYDQAAAQLEAARAAALKAERQIASARAAIEVASAQRERAEVVRTDSYLIAPITGLISRFNIEQGYYFSPQLVQTSSEQGALDTVPVVLLDTSQFEIAVTMRSETCDDLEVGAPVLTEVIPPDATLEERLPDEAGGPPRPAEAHEIAGRIYSISPSFDPENRTFRMKVRTERGAERIRDGESVSLWIAKAVR